MKPLARSCTLVLLALALCLAMIGCRASEATTASQQEAVPLATVRAATEGTVLAQGMVEPARTLTLRAWEINAIAAVEAEVGDVIEAGASLIHLDPTDAELSVQAAEAGLMAAQATLDRVRTGARSQEITALKAALAAAEATLEMAKAQEAERQSGLESAEVTRAQADIVAAQTSDWQAADLHEQTMTCFTIPTADGDEREICPALGPQEEMARHQVEIADAALGAAQARLDSLQSGAPARDAESQAAIEAAEGRLESARAQLEAAEAGSRRQEIAVAEAATERARSILAQAETRLSKMTVEAPFTAHVIDIPHRPQDVVSEGESLVTIATLDHLRVRTLDLNQNEVVQIEVGDKAWIIADAVPDQPLAAQVTRIDRQAVDYLGDVAYPVLIDLVKEPPDWLRWGMSVQVAVGSDAGGAPQTADQSVSRPTAAPIEGAITPARMSRIPFRVAGRIADIPISIGETVAPGDALVRLDAEGAQLAVAEAEAALSTAEAELALLQAGPTIGQIDAAQADVKAAQAEVTRAEASQRQMQGNAEAEQAAAEVSLQAAEAELHQARIALDHARDSDEDDAQRTAQERVHMAELRLSAARRNVDALPAAWSARIDAARARVAQAQAQLDAAHAKLDLLHAGPLASEIAAAEARVTQAESSLFAAQVTLRRTILRAPFAGTVTQLPAEVGDTVAPGQPVLVLATLDQLQVETTDLTEFDVVHVAVRESVTITADALPERAFRGTVVAIDARGEPVLDDMTYEATIKLQNPPPTLMWGMTVLVDFPH